MEKHTSDTLIVLKKCRNREVSLHFGNGLGIHHAGMLRGDRNLTEQLFNDGAIKVLACTATLAWGINLPAHTVIIKGTEVYNPEKGGMMDLSILDVQQIFGRAGRPQFDTSGEATLITTHDGLPRYLDKLVRAVPIESKFIKQLADHLNAEVVRRDCHEHPGSGNMVELHLLTRSDGEESTCIRNNCRSKGGRSNAQRA